MIYHFSEAGDLVFSEITYPGVRINTRFLQDVLRPRNTDTIDVSKGDFQPLIPG
jgi:hypothetical protein